MSSFTIKKSVYIDANPEVVFDALTSSAAIPNYFPIKKVTSDWKVGSVDLLDGEIDGKPFRDHGVIEALSRPTQFQYSYWSDNHGTERTSENHLTISYRLFPQRNGTQLNLEHSNIRSEKMLKIMETVWDSLLRRFRNYVEHRT